VKEALILVKIPMVHVQTAKVRGPPEMPPEEAVNSRVEKPPDLSA
jgi:hypothetical protein